MKNKKQILSLIACLSLLSSCNKTTPSSKSCSITTSTPTSSVTPSKTVEELNKELFENYASIALYNGTNYSLRSFSNEIPEELKNLETIIIPKEINGKPIVDIYNSSNGIFKGFPNLKKIQIPDTITSISCSITYAESSSPFINLPNLENIEVDSNNQSFYTKGNCLIRTSDNLIVCGWKNVEIPDEVTEIRNVAFSNNSSINSIKLNKNIEIIGESSFRLLDLKNISDIDLNGNTNFKVENNVMYDNNKIYFAVGEIITPKPITDIFLYGLNNVTKVTLSDAVESIRAGSFNNTNIEYVYISQSVNTIDINSFKYMKELSKIELSPLNQYFKLEGNVLYRIYDNKMFVGYKDVVLPSVITKPSFQECVSITSIKLHDKVTNLDYQAFNNINYVSSNSKYNRDYKDYIKITIDSNNTEYCMSDDNRSIIKKSTQGNSLIYAIPDESGNVNVPDSITDFSVNFSYCFDPKIAKSINFNEGLKSISSYASLSNSSIVEIELPSTLEDIYIADSTGSNPLAAIVNLKSIKLKNDGNAYFKIDGNCLIKKNGNKFILGCGDVVIPEYITTLGIGVFNSNYSINSITLHNKLSIKVNATWTTFTNLTSNCKTIKFLGTLDEFKSTIGTDSNSGSLYDCLKKYTWLTIVVLDNDGNEVTYQMMDLINNN